MSVYDCAANMTVYDCAVGFLFRVLLVSAIRSLVKNSKNRNN